MDSAFGTQDGSAGDSDAPGGTGGDGGDDVASSAPEEEAGSTGTEGSGDDGSTSPILFDVPPDDPVRPKVCTVPANELDGGLPCNWVAPDPDDAFNPEVQWEWFGANGDVQSIVTPLVANLTDDNDDGSIDLCDIPDVIVLAGPDVSEDPIGHLYVLDGETGTVHFSIPQGVLMAVSPALGDIDGDGLIEIVALDENEQLVAFDHDGTLKWTSKLPFSHAGQPIALAIADLDADGEPEIFGDNIVADANGQLVFSTGTDYSFAPTAADLDGDGLLEVVYGSAAYRADGTPLFLGAPGSNGGFPQVADLDGDGAPEIVISGLGGLSILSADGSPIIIGATPTGDTGLADWLRPATIHDFSGDGVPQIAMSSSAHYSVMTLSVGGPDGPELTVDWTADVVDASGIAGGTAFDFLGDGVAEAMYADETTMFVFDGAVGDVLLTADRASRTLIEYPVVADIDNDGAAEIVVVSNEVPSNEAPGPGAPPTATVTVIRNSSDLWVPTRRIWNQHTYHVTNVREDGTIPTVEPKHWEANNTFRTNAQISGGAVCTPAS